MNLIVNRRLDSQEEQAIYELTLKKQRSKKSTVGEKNAAAMQQLAGELLRERRHLEDQQQEHQDQLGSLLPYHKRELALCRCHSAGAVTQPSGKLIGHQPRAAKPEQATTPTQPPTASVPFDEVHHSTDATDLVTDEESTKLGHDEAEPQRHKQVELQRQSSTSTIATETASSSSNTSCGSSNNGLNLRLHHCPSTASSTQQARKINLPAKSISFLSSTGSSHSSNAPANLPDEASLKLYQLRLEQLNNELERRLHQYEYLVAQEKAILGTYNLNLFTSKGINNFQRFETNANKNTLQSSQSWSHFQMCQSRKF